MTLISCIVSPDTYLALGDIIKSRPTKGNPPPIHLPLASEMVAHTAADDSDVLGFIQKLIVKNRTILQWSGSVAVSSVIATMIFELSNNGMIFVDLHETIASSGLSPTETKEVSIIYSYFNEISGSVVVQTHECQNRSKNNINLYSAGSGQWPFFDNIESEHDTSHDAQQVLRSFFSRAIYNLCSERFTSFNYDYLYGGWFEFCVLRGGLPQKLKYAVIFWQKSPNDLPEMCDLNFVGLTYCHYNEDYLVVSSLDIVGDQQRRRTFAVESFVSSGKLTREYPPYRPDMVFHMILSDEIGSVYAESNPTGVQFEFAGRGIKSIVVENQFMKELAASLESGGIMRQKFSDWTGDYSRLLDGPLPPETKGK